MPTAQPTQLSKLNRQYLSERQLIDQEMRIGRYPAQLINRNIVTRNQIVELQNGLRAMKGGM